MAIAVRAVGAIASGAGTITPGLPSGTVKGDLLVMVCESKSGQAVTCAGWEEAPNSPQEDTTDSTRLTILWRRAQGSDARTTNDPGDHIIARIIGFSGVKGFGSPWDVTAGGTESTADTSGSIPGATTTVDGCMIIAACCEGIDPASNNTTGFSSWANANLASITERIDNRRVDGDGGGIGAATGIKTTAGNYGNTTVTFADSARKGLWSGALLPEVPIEQLTDNFDDNSFDLQKFVEWNAGDVSETSQTLRITSNLAAAYKGYDTTGIFPLTGSFVSIELVHAITGLTDDGTFLQITLNSTNTITFYVYNDTLIAETQVASSYSTIASAAYNSTNHRWIRIRESGGTIYFDTSPDGYSDNWTNFASVANPFAITAVYASVFIGTDAANGSTDTAIIDNFNVVKVKSERSAKVTGKDTSNSERSAKLTGASSGTSTNDERSAKITGKDTSSSERPAKLSGQDSANSERSAKILGINLTEVFSDNFDDNSLDGAKWATYGSNVHEQNQQLEIDTGLSPGYSGIYSLGGLLGSDYKLTGSYVKVKIKSAGNQTLVSGEFYPVFLKYDDDNNISWLIAGGSLIAGKKIATTFTSLDSRTFNIISHRYLRIRESGGTTYWEFSATGLDSDWTIAHSESSPISTERLEIHAFGGNWNTELTTTTYAIDSLNVGDVASERSAKITGKDTSDSERSASIIGKDTANSERSAKTLGQDSSNSERSAKLLGNDTSYSEREAKITGTDTSNSERQAKLLGQDFSSSERAVKLQGSDTSLSERSAKTLGQDTANNERNASLTGKDTSDSERSATVVGIAGEYSERSATIVGQEFTSSERSANITGKDTDSSERQAKIYGQDSTNTEREAKITGQLATDSERSVKITGSDTSNSERQAKIDGQYESNSEIWASLTGQDTNQSERWLKIHGKEIIVFERWAKIVGKLDRGRPTILSTPYGGVVLESRQSSTPISSQAVTTPVSDSSSTPLLGKSPTSL